MKYNFFNGGDNMKKSKYPEGLYKRVEAMYYTDRSASEIARECGIEKMDALNMLQHIFAKNQEKRKSSSY